jgi:hypothetical protein
MLPITPLKNRVSRKLHPDDGECIAAYAIGEQDAEAVGLIVGGGAYTIRVYGEPYSLEQANALTRALIAVQRIARMRDQERPGSAMEMAVIRGFESPISAVSLAVIRFYCEMIYGAEDRSRIDDVLREFIVEAAHNPERPEHQRRAAMTAMAFISNFDKDSRMLNNLYEIAAKGSQAECNLVWGAITEAMQWQSNAKF